MTILAGRGSTFDMKSWTNMTISKCDNQEKYKKQIIKNRWLTWKYQLFSKFIISSRWTTAYPGTKAFQAYLSTQKFTGRKDRNSLVVEHQHDTHCPCTIHSGFKQKRNWRKTASILAKILHFLVLLVTGGTKQWLWSDKGQEQHPKRQHCNVFLAEFPSGSTKCAQGMPVAVCYLPGLPFYLAGWILVWGFWGTLASWPKDPFWQSSGMRMKLPNLFHQPSLARKWGRYNERKWPQAAPGRFRLNARKYFCTKTFDRH